jgi:hypothetical protein
MVKLFWFEPRKRSLSLRTLRRTRCNFFCRCHLSSKNFENGNHSIGYQPNYYPYSALWFLQTPIAEYEIKQETPIEIILWEKLEIYKSDSIKNLLPFMFDKKFL